MIYLSQILKGVIQDSSDKNIGILHDIVLKTENRSYPSVHSLVVQCYGTKEKVYIPYTYVDNLGRREIVLNTTFENIKFADKEENSIYINRDILDNQIIDVNGVRVVRVNDIKLATIEKHLSLVGLDISFKGILRRLGMTWLDVFQILKVNLIDWRDAQLVHGTLQINTVSKQLNRLHPADIANIVEQMNVKQSTHLLRTLDKKDSAKILEEMDPYTQKMVVRLLGKKKAAEILENMSIDELADLIQALPRHEAKGFLSQLHKDKLDKIEILLSYPEDTAGGLMTNEFMTAYPEWTVEETIKKIKEVSLKFRSILFIYVTNKQGKLIGPISMRNLAIAGKEIKLNDLVKHIDLSTVLKPDDTVEDVINMMTKYDLFSAAVIDKKGKIVGIITLDDVMRYLAPKA